jgi:hypothetical protein
MIALDREVHEHNGPLLREDRVGKKHPGKHGSASQNTKHRISLPNLLQQVRAFRARYQAPHPQEQREMRGPEAFVTHPVVLASGRERRAFLTSEEAIGG